MKYMFLIYGGGRRDEFTREQIAATMPAWDAYIEELTAKGAYISGSALAEPSSATTLRQQEGKRLVSDGPFAETKEWLGGYILVELASLDEAIEYAAKCPAAAAGPIEIRPLVDARTLVES